MKNSLEIGSRIRKLREEFHMNRNIFSEQIDISETYLAQLERGEKSPSLRVIYSICSFTDCTSDYLLFGKIDEETNDTRKKLNNLIMRSKEENLVLYYDVLHSIKSHLKD